MVFLKYAFKKTYTSNKLLTKVLRKTAFNPFLSKEERKEGVGRGAQYLQVDGNWRFSERYFEIWEKYGRETVFPTLDGAGNY